MMQFQNKENMIPSMVRSLLSRENVLLILRYSFYNWIFSIFTLTVWLPFYRFYDMPWSYYIVNGLELYFYISHSTYFQCSTPIVNKKSREQRSFARYILQNLVDFIIVYIKYDQRRDYIIVLWLLDIKIRLFLYPYLAHTW